MDNISGLVIGASLIGLVLLVVVLIAIFYKPAKRLEVTCNFKPDSDKTDSVIKVAVKNIGKKRLKLVAPYVKFSHYTHFKLYQITSAKAHCKFPRIMKIGDEIGCEVDLTPYKDLLAKNEWHPTHVRVIVKDTVGLEFQSENLDYKL